MYLWYHPLPAGNERSTSAGRCCVSHNRGQIRAHKRRLPLRLVANHAIKLCIQASWRIPGGRGAIRGSFVPLHKFPIRPLYPFTPHGSLSQHGFQLFLSVVRLKMSSDNTCSPALTRRCCCEERKGWGIGQAPLSHRRHAEAL